HRQRSVRAPSDCLERMRVGGAISLGRFLRPTTARQAQAQPALELLHCLAILLVSPSDFANEHGGDLLRRPPGWRWIEAHVARHRSRQRLAHGFPGSPLSPGSDSEILRDNVGERVGGLRAAFPRLRPELTKSFSAWRKLWSG